MCAYVGHIWVITICGAFLVYFLIHPPSATLQASGPPVNSLMVEFLHECLSTMNLFRFYGSKLGGGGAGDSLPLDLTANMWHKLKPRTVVVHKARFYN